MPALGYTLQIYAGASGYSTAKLVALLPAWKAAGVKRVVLHTFVGVTNRAQFEAWAQKVIAAGLEAGCAFGLGASNRDHPTDTGTKMGLVFASPLCSIGMVDAEGAFDNDAAAKTKLMMTAMRIAAPFAFIVDQPWPIILLHAGFPIEVFSAAVDEHAAQVYINDWKSTYGLSRYLHIVNWYESQWEEVERKRLAPKGLVKPRGVTMQGYGFDDIPWDCVRMLMRWRDARIWCEWAPSEVLLMCMRAVEYLAAHNYTLDDAGVVKFQRDNGLKADGQCGFKTMAAMGITPKGVVGRAIQAVRLALAA